MDPDITPYFSNRVFLTSFWRDHSAMLGLGSSGKAG
jgi:hypothetical protein